MRRAALVAALVLLTACGGDPAPRATQAPSPTVAETEPAPPGPISAACSDETVTGEPQFTIEAVDNEFAPECAVVLGGQGLEFVNAGSNPHTFTIEGTDVDLEIRPGGEPVRTEAIGGAVPPGTHTYFCRFHRAEGMDGELTVTDVG